MLWILQSLQAKPEEGINLVYQGIVVALSGNFSCETGKSPLSEMCRLHLFLPDPASRLSDCQPRNLRFVGAPRELFSLVVAKMQT